MKGTMRLKNKKTGKIVDFRYLQSDHVAPLVLTTYENNKPEMYSYNSLAGLNEEWEDAPEEPKDYWYLNEFGDVIRAVYKTDDFDHNLEAIGNRFETPEEAELAVRKLEAWKRLKDEYDFKFTGWKRDEQFRGDFIITAQDWNTSDDKLLDLLFGGEE